MLFSYVLFLQRKGMATRMAAYMADSVRYLEAQPCLATKFGKLLFQWTPLYCSESACPTPDSGLPMQHEKGIQEEQYSTEC